MTLKKFYKTDTQEKQTFLTITLIKYNKRHDPSAVTVYTVIKPSKLARFEVKKYFFNIGGTG